MSSNLLIDEPPLQVLPTLAKLVGLNEAIVLQQIHYWLNPHHNKNIYNGYHWVFNSYEDWQTQFPFWSKDTIRRVIASLEKAEFICTDNFNKDRFNHRKWYRINYTKLQQLKSSPDRCVQNAYIESGNLQPSKVATYNDRLLQGELIEDRIIYTSIHAECIDHYKEQRILTEITTENTQNTARAHLIEKMIVHWNEIIEQQSPKVKTTTARLKRLDKLVETFFSDDLESWKEYCCRIKASTFLMGQGRQGWKVSFDWATDPQNIQKVLEGNFDSGTYKNQNFKNQFSAERVQEIIASHKDDKRTQTFLQCISEQISACDFISFFEKVKILESREKSASLSVPKAFYVSYLTQKFYQNILASLQLVDPSLEYFDLVFVPQTHSISEDSGEKI